VDKELLRLAFRSLRKQAAPGVDGQSYEEYAANLDQNLQDLYARLKSGRYRAPVIRRVYIPKANGKRRPLGITTIEDRVVQKAVAWVLRACKTITSGIWGLPVKWSAGVKCGHRATMEN